MLVACTVQYHQVAIITSLSLRPWLHIHSYLHRDRVIMSTGVESSCLYRLRLHAYQARKRSVRIKWFVLMAVGLLCCCWIALNETFALKLIFEQECLEDPKKNKNKHISWFSCLSSARERWFHRLSPRDAEKLHLALRRDSNKACSGRVRRFGNSRDGGWDICMDDFQQRQREESSSSSCRVYSFGIALDPSFDVSLTEAWTECTVFAFDPSLGRQTGDSYLGERVHFYNIGLSGRNYTNNKGWKMMDLGSIMKMLGHTYVDLVKMDVELSEWETFQHWRELSAETLDRIRYQLLVELHFSSPSGKVTTQMGAKLETLAWIQSQGFEVFSLRENWRFSRLIDYHTIDDDKSVVRANSNIEVGWRRVRGTS